MTVEFKEPLPKLKVGIHGYFVKYESSTYEDTDGYEKLIETVVLKNSEGREQILRGELTGPSRRFLDNKKIVEGTRFIAVCEIVNRRLVNVTRYRAEFNWYPTLRLVGLSLLDNGTKVRPDNNKIGGVDPKVRKDSKKHREPYEAPTIKDPQPIEEVPVVGDILSEELQNRGEEAIKAAKQRMYNQTIEKDYDLRGEDFDEL